MKNEEIKKTVVSLFDDDGNLLPKADREVITEDCEFFPEDLVTTRVSVSGDLPMQIAKFGWAKTSFHISVPCALESGELERAKKFALKQRDEFLESEAENYKQFLDGLGIDYGKVDQQMKGK